MGRVLSLVELHDRLEWEQRDKPALLELDVGHCGPPLEPGLGVGQDVDAHPCRLAFLHMGSSRRAKGVELGLPTQFP